MANAVRVSMSEATRAVMDAGFTGWRVPTFVAIGFAESGGDIYALNLNIKPGKQDHLSLDIGFFQINDYWWPKYSRAQVTDLWESARCVYKEVGGNEGIFKATKSKVGGYKLWSTYNALAHKKFEAEAVRTAKQLGVVL